MPQLLDQALWERLKVLSFDYPDSTIPFSKRLAKEQEWDEGYAQAVVEEYRKFLYLAMVAGPVTPSKEVDEAWHLHLKNPIHYKEALCEKTLLRKLEHIPSDGSEVDREKHKAQYAKTLEVYEKNFGEAPWDIWRIDQLEPIDRLEKKKINFMPYNLILFGLFVISLFINSPILLGITFVSAFILFLAYVYENIPLNRKKENGGCSTYVGVSCGSSDGGGGGGD